MKVSILYCVIYIVCVKLLLIELKHIQNGNSQFVTTPKCHRMLLTHSYLLAHHP